MAFGNLCAGSDHQSNKVALGNVFPKFLEAELRGGCGGVSGAGMAFGTRLCLLGRCGLRFCCGRRSGALCCLRLVSGGAPSPPFPCLPSPRVCPFPVFCLVPSV